MVPHGLCTSIVTQKRDEIIAAYDTIKDEVFAELQIEWEWYGYNADIA